MKDDKRNMINILTIFPEMFSPLRESMLGRAESRGLLSINIVDIREFSKDKHRKTDDYPFGGGQGMVFTPQPAFDALKNVGAEHTRNIYMSPRGRLLDADLIKELAAYLAAANPDAANTNAANPNAANPDAVAARKAGLTIFCGHYEGVDQRIIDIWNMEEISIGDYVLTGGEIPAMVLVDAVARLIPGVLGEENSPLDESIYSGLLEFPQYTQPRYYDELQGSSLEGKRISFDVPEVLLSGNHKAIGLWRLEKSLELTKKRRPDILKAFLKNHRELNKDELRILINVLNKREIALLEKHLSEKETKAFRKIIRNMNF